MVSMKKIFYVIYLSFIFTKLAFANTELKQLFSASFSTYYVEAKCGENILGLIQRADNKKINLNTANILEISNVGFSVFGLLNAEYARAGGRHGAPGERNWYHHVVLEMDGFIYDFDFGNTPNITTTKKYFEQMFLDDKRKSEGGEFYVGREEKLKYYEIVVKPALATMYARRDRVASPSGETMRLQQFLDIYGK